MKKTSFIRQINKENRKYKIVKSIAYLQTKLSFGEKRKLKEFAYSIFETDDYFDKNNNALPEQYYFKPTDIIIYDLLRKEDLAKVKKGLVKLYKKCYSHKFIGGGKSEEDVENIIQGLDKTLHSGNSWYRTSRFDFAFDDDLEEYGFAINASFQLLFRRSIAHSLQPEASIHAACLKSHNYIVSNNHNNSDINRLETPLLCVSTHGAPSFAKISRAHRITGAFLISFHLC